MFARNPNYSTKALLMRESLKFDPMVLRLLRKIWDVTDGDASGDVDFQEYTIMFRKLHIVLYGHSADRQLAAKHAEALAAKEWIVDSMGYHSMGPPLFKQSWFQLADQWTDEIDAMEYCCFLADVVECLTVTSPGTGCCEFRDDEDIRTLAEVRASRSVMDQKAFSIIGKQKGEMGIRGERFAGALPMGSVVVGRLNEAGDAAAGERCGKCVRGGWWRCGCQSFEGEVIRSTELVKNGKKTRMVYDVCCSDGGRGMMRNVDYRRLHLIKAGPGHPTRKEELFVVGMDVQARLYGRGPWQMARVHCVREDGCVDLYYPKLNPKKKPKQAPLLMLPEDQVQTSSGTTEAAATAAQIAAAAVKVASDVVVEANNIIAKEMVAVATREKAKAEREKGKEGAVLSIDKQLDRLSKAQEDGVTLHIALHIADKLAEADTKKEEPNRKAKMSMLRHGATFAAVMGRANNVIGGTDEEEAEAKSGAKSEAKSEAKEGQQAEAVTWGFQVGASSTAGEWVQQASQILRVSGDDDSDGQALVRPSEWEELYSQRPGTCNAETFDQRQSRVRREEKQFDRAKTRVASFKPKRKEVDFVQHNAKHVIKQNKAAALEVNSFVISTNGSHTHSFVRTSPTNPPTHPPTHQPTTP
jgi:hypothetical protein